jgi:hypothetical protein
LFLVVIFILNLAKICLQTIYTDKKDMFTDAKQHFYYIIKLKAYYFQI